MFAEVVQVTIKPAKNADRPAIELTDRTQRYPRYMVPLIMAKWGPKAKIEVAEIAEGLDRHWQLPLQPNMSPEESELLRCKRYVGKETFYEAYRDEEFKAKVRSVLSEKNPFREAKDAAEAELTDRATSKAADTLVKAATDAQRRQERKRAAAAGKPGRPSRVPAGV